MAEAALALGLKSVPIVTEHYDKVYDPVKNKTKQGVQKVKRMRSNKNGDGGGYESEEDYLEYDGPPRRSNNERRRSPRRDDRRRSGRGDFVEERYAYRSGGRAKSVGRDDRRKGSRRDYSDSESSMSPPRRKDRRRKSLGEKAMQALGLGAIGGAAAGSDRDRRRSRDRSDSRDRGGRRDKSYGRDYDRRDDRSRGPPSSRGYYDDRTPDRYKPAGYIQNGGGSERGGGGGGVGSQVARRNNNNNNNNNSRNDSRNGAEGRGQKNDSSSDESSEVCSSSEDERREKKMKGKEYLTAGLAAVATIHAAHNVYSSMAARDKRVMEVAKGKITEDESRKQKNKARLQDAAAIGIAALGIKGAYSEWQEVQEHRHELAEQQKEREKHHQKRLKKASKYGGSNGGGSNQGSQYGRRNRSEPDLNRKRDQNY